MRKPNTRHRSIRWLVAIRRNFGRTLFDQLVGFPLLNGCLSANVNYLCSRSIDCVRFFAINFMAASTYSLYAESIAFADGRSEVVSGTYDEHALCEVYNAQFWGRSLLVSMTAACNFRAKAPSFIEVM